MPFQSHTSCDRVDATAGTLRPATDIAHLQIDPQEPTAVYANSVLVHGLPADAVEALVASAGPGSGTAGELEAGRTSSLEGAT